MADLSDPGALVQLCHSGAESDLRISPAKLDGGIIPSVKCGFQLRTSSRQTYQRELDAIPLAMDTVRELCENIDKADWVTKRRLLYLFGVKVFMCHTGTDADGQGHRRCIKYGWDGLEELLNTKLMV